MVPDPRETLPAFLDAIRLVRTELRDDQAVVGFCGAPFTVAGYLIEGKPSRDFARDEALMYSTPEVWHALAAKLADAFSAYVAAQVDAGADAIQLFDSWAGALSAADYLEFVAPYSARILAAVDAPTIHFATGAGHLLPDLAEAGGDVIGLDWRIPLSRAGRSSATTAACKETSTRRSCWAVGNARATQLRHSRRGRRSRRAYLQPRSRCSPRDGPGHVGPTGGTGARANSGGGVRVKTAVIVMAYGSPSSIEDVPAYLQDVRGGRPARSEAVE